MAEGQIETGNLEHRDPNEVDATPAKRFFVEMLTRDIELTDAILDLLDNCVDGAMRSKPKANSPSNKPYDGYFAEIRFSPTEFSIKDNCGGIDHDTARKHALRLGRPENRIEEGLATVGVYGIGMKRAIFKMGYSANIYSNHPDGAYNIPITPSWLEEDGSWKLRMFPATASEEYGTHITVENLRPGVSSFFDNTIENFESKFTHILVTHYSYIIEKGFCVKINGTPIKPKIPRLLLNREAINSNKGILPYLYETNKDGVEVKLIMGLYQNLPSEEDVEDGHEGKKNKNDAGWTIICNDRIVLDNDKTHLTGWGVAGVPQYHSQFISIAGLVSFYTDDAKKLPVKTTKRGIDLDSEIYAQVKDVMRDALKTFTSFTNKWKSDTDERKAMHSTAEAIDIREVAELIPKTLWSNVTRGAQGKRYVPELPTSSEKNSFAKITFNKDKKEIQEIRNYLEQDEDTSASDIGKLSFELVLNKARGK